MTTNWAKGWPRQMWTECVLRQSRIRSKVPQVWLLGSSITFKSTPIADNSGRGTNSPKVSGRRWEVYDVRTVVRVFGAKSNPKLALTTCPAYSGGSILTLSGSLGCRSCCWAILIYFSEKKHWIIKKLDFNIKKEHTHYITFHKNYTQHYSKLRIARGFNCCRTSGQLKVTPEFPKQCQERCPPPISRDVTGNSR